MASGGVPGPLVLTKIGIGRLMTPEALDPSANPHCHNSPRCPEEPPTCRAPGRGFHKSSRTCPWGGVGGCGWEALPAPWSQLSIHPLGGQRDQLGMGRHWPQSRKSRF